MLEITKENIEDYRCENNLSALADSWLQDVVDFNKIEELKELIKDQNIDKWEDLIETLSLFENQGELANRLEID